MNDNLLTDFRSSLRKIERYLFQSIKDDGICCGITFNECHILMEILDNNEIFMSSLINNLGLDKSIISKSVDAMVKKRLLKRIESDEDRRKKVLELSDEGKEKALSIRKYMNNKYKSLLESLKKEEQEEILKSGKLLADIFSSWMETEKNKGIKNGCCI